MRELLYQLQQFSQKQPELCRQMMDLLGEPCAINVEKIEGQEIPVNCHRCPEDGMFLGAAFNLILAQ